MTPQSQMPPEQAPPNEGASQGINDQLRQLIMSIGSLTQQVPEAQQELTAAARALTAASLKVVAAQREPATGQPMIVS